MKYQLQFSLILFLLVSLFAYGQHEHDDEEGVFAYANNTSGARATYLLKKQDYKYKVAKGVLDDLILAKGDRRQKAPRFEMSNSTRKVAFANLNAGLIGLEEKGYDVCMSFGKDSLNALAALLSHELIHYYDKHDWEGRQKKELETQADYLGGFLAFTAGYNTLGIMPQFLKKTYDAYSFPTEMRGYPSLEERQDYANRSLEKLRKLIGVFETANYMALLEDFEHAQLYYEYILQEEFQSREIYNNLGVLATLRGIKLFQNDELKFAYPVELDAVSRLKFGTRAPGAGEAREALFRNAISYFDQAKDLDPDYATAWLNLSCAHALLEEYFDAEYFVRKALSLSTEQNNSKVLGDVYAMMGIIAGLQGKDEEASRQFEKGMELNNPIAKINFEILNGTHESVPTRQGLPNNQEKIEDINLNLVVNKLIMGSFEADEQIELDRKTYFVQQNHEASKILINFLPYGKDPVYNIFHVTEPHYSGQTLRGIAIGSSKDQVLESYGAPSKTIQSTEGQFMVYRNKNIAFEVDSSDQVVSWCVLRIELKKPN